jgi:hypothetical protein
MPREKHYLRLDIPFCDPGRPVPNAFAHLFSVTLKCILGDLNLGRSEAGGGTSKRNPDGTFTEISSNSSIHIKGDLDQGVHLLRNLLWWSQAPAAVQLRENYRRDIPLNLGQPPQDAAAVAGGIGQSDVLRLAKLTVVRWRSGYRIDHVPLDAACRQGIREALSRHGARGPDEDGWFDVAARDGDRLRLCARRMDDDPELDGATLVIERLSHDIAALVHELMSNNGLMLLPLVVAPSASVAEQVTGTWPPPRVVETPSRLHEIFAAGAFAWWNNS